MVGRRLVVGAEDNAARRSRSRERPERARRLAGLRRPIEAIVRRRRGEQASCIDLRREDGDRVSRAGPRRAAGRQGWLAAADPDDPARRGLALLDPRDGVQEMIDRRIGHNELDTN